MSDSLDAFVTEFDGYLINKQGVKFDFKWHSYRFLKTSIYPDVWIFRYKIWISSSTYIFIIIIIVVVIIIVIIIIILQIL